MIKVVVSIVSLVVLCLSAYLFVVLSEVSIRPFSTRYVDPGFPDHPSEFPVLDVANESEQLVFGTLLFTGDIMQHASQKYADFDKSYHLLRSRFSQADFVMGNLEFPILPSDEIGPERGSVRFNGSVDHLAALAKSGFDMLATANNHAFDRGIEGVESTINLIAKHGMGSCGTIAELDQRATPCLVSIRGKSIAILAYTYGFNRYLQRNGIADVEPRHMLGINMLPFELWETEDRQRAIALVRQDVLAARRVGAELVIAFVHWGDEWRYQPNASQRQAARDLVINGVDLIIGAGSHVLGTVELVEDVPVVYSLGNLLSAFRIFEQRVGAVLEVQLTHDMRTDRLKIGSLRFLPLLVDGFQVVTPVGKASRGQGLRAWELARRALGPSVSDRW